MARPIGARGKNKSFLLNRLQAMYGEDFHPLMQMAKNAWELQQVVDSGEGESRDRIAVIDAWDKVAQYTEPKLKAIEHSGEIEGGRAVISDKPMTTNEWDEKYATDLESTDRTSTSTH